MICEVGIDKQHRRITSASKSRVLRQGYAMFGSVQRVSPQEWLKKSVVGDSRKDYFRKTGVSCSSDCLFNRLIHGIIYHIVWLVGYFSYLA